MFYRDEKEDNHKTNVVTETENSTMEVDEDGFCIRPKTSQVWTSDKNSFYSSTDSDSGELKILHKNVVSNVNYKISHR